MADDAVETVLAHAFERFFRSLDGLVHMLKEAIPDVLGRASRYEDVGRLAPDLKIADDRVDEFVALWEAEFGTREFKAILRAPPTSDDATSEDDVGHDVRPQPEESAEYRPSVTSFLLEHGSLLDLQEAMRRHGRLGSHARTMAGSAVVLAVGAIESAIVELERVRLRQHPDAMGTDAKEFSLGDLMRLGDLALAIEHAVDTRVEALSFGGSGKWREWYRAAFGLDMAELARDWERFKEVVQRRHVIVHNGGHASRLYIQRTQAKDLKPGDVVSLDPKYVFPAVTECYVLGLRMVIRAWEKLGDDVGHLRGHVTNRCYDTLVSGDWEVAEVLAAEGMRLAVPQSRGELVNRVNLWLAKKYRGVDITEEVEQWEAEALNLSFRIAKSALLDDYDQLGNLIPAALAAEELHRSELVAWPMFRGLREQALFVDLLAGMDAPPDEGAGT